MKALSSIVIFTLFTTLFSGCGSGVDEVTEVNASSIELNEYETVVEFEDNLLGRPSIVHFDRYTGNLFVYDYGLHTLFEIDRSGEVINEFGGEGEGPGELAGAWNFFVHENEIYIQDHLRFYIHRYTRDGDFIDSFDYGHQRSRSVNGPPAPPAPPIPTDFYNEPFVISQGQVVLPTPENERFLYQLHNWDGEQLTEIGERPAEHLETIDDDTHRSFITSRNIPPTELRRAFLVNIPPEPGEFYIIYSNENLVSRYNRDGEKIWERELPETPELSQVEDDYFSMMEGMQPGSRFPLRRYVHGVASPDGELYLTTYTNIYSPFDEKRPLFVHRISSDGELLDRYKLESDDENNLAIQIAVDFENQVFYTIVQESGEGRAYPLNK